VNREPPYLIIIKRGTRRNARKGGRDPMLDEVPFSFSFFLQAYCCSVVTRRSR